MARQTSYDLDQFRKLVLEGKTKGQIMKEMDIKGYPQFSALELRLIKTDKQFLPLFLRHCCKKKERYRRDPSRGELP